MLRLQLNEANIETEDLDTRKTARKGGFFAQRTKFIKFSHLCTKLRKVFKSIYECSSKSVCSRSRNTASRIDWS